MKTATLLRYNILFSQKYFPIVAIITISLSLFIFYRFGITLTTIAALIFTWMLIVLSYIDLQQQLLPDAMTLSLLWLGLLFNLSHGFCSTQSAVLGAVFGYVSLWLIAKIFYLVTREVGMGHGDYKLLAALGAWLGWHSVIAIIFIASALGSGVGLSLILFKKHQYKTPLAFGPYLAIAGWIMMVKS